MSAVAANNNNNDDEQNQQQQLTQTPRGQKSIQDPLGGSVTPPSSGSSARRRKLQRMREQAMAASTIDANTTTNNNDSDDKPPTTASENDPAPSNAAPPTSSSTTSFYTSTGAPATDAFAKAIASRKTTPPDLPSLAGRGGGIAVGGDEPPKLPAATTSAAQARLEEAFRKASSEKTAGLARIRELEEKLSDQSREFLELARQANKQQKLDVHEMLSVAEREGPDAALVWAKSHPQFASQPAAGFGFRTGVAAPSPKRRARIAGRALRAHPTARGLAPTTEKESIAAATQTERANIEKFREAADHVPVEGGLVQRRAVLFYTFVRGIPLVAGCRC